MLERASLI